MNHPRTIRACQRLALALLSTARHLIAAALIPLAVADALDRRERVAAAHDHHARQRLLEREAHRAQIRLY